MNFNNIKYYKSYGTSQQLPSVTKPEIAFSGRSNVGKSSLLNRLFGRKSLARTSSSPGKTTTVNFYDAGESYFTDLPGYGYAKRSQTETRRWADLMEGYFNTGREIRLVLQLIDMRHAPTRDDLDMIEFLNSANYPYIIVLTKKDKLKPSELKSRREAIPNELKSSKAIEMIEFSAVTGDGVQELRAAIESALC